MESIYKTFTRTICINCKNRNTDLCHIRKDIKGTLKCIYYEKDKNLEGYKQLKNRTAYQQKPLMKL